MKNTTLLSGLQMFFAARKTYFFFYMLFIFIVGFIFFSDASAKNAVAKEKLFSNNKKIFAKRKLKNISNITKEQLGQSLFFDTNLSKRRTMSCATCHNPAAAFIDVRKTTAQRMSSLGNDNKSFGDRNAPTASYAAFAPEFFYSRKKKTYMGGQFLDGRAATLADQAGGPPLNSIEMQMPNKEAVVARLQENLFYVAVFEKFYGQDIWQDTQKAYKSMTLAIQSFEKSEFFSPFDSKYDRYLRGEYELTVLEDLGRSLFFSNTNVNCATCHKLKIEDAEEEVFTNYEYRNIGVPRNLKLIANSKLPKDFIDHGLLQNPLVKNKKHDGKFKVPTLRNIAVTAPYMHNGVFKDLRTVVLFYDKYNNPKRKINPETNLPWAGAEVPETIALDELRAKELTDKKVDALVAFMRLLTDKKYEHLLEPMKKNK